MRRKIEVALSWLFVVISLVALNGFAYYLVPRALDSFSFFTTAHLYADIQALVTCLGASVGAVGFDKLVLDGLCRGHVIPDVKSRLNRSKVAPGDIVHVEYEILGSEDWVNKVRAYLKCMAISRDLQSRVLFNDLVYATPAKGVHATGRFSFQVPEGFPATNLQSQHKTVLWVLEIRGATHGLIRDAKAFHDLTVEKHC